MPTSIDKQENKYNVWFCDRRKVSLKQVLLKDQIKGYTTFTTSVSLWRSRKQLLLHFISKNSHPKVTRKALKKKQLLRSL